MCVVLGYIARLLEMLQDIFYMTSISGDTQLSSVPELLYCHPARVDGDTSHGTLTALLSCFSSLGLSLYTADFRYPHRK